MNERGERRRWQRVVDELVLPEPFDLQVLSAQVSSRTGRPIRLMPHQGHGQAPCGLLVRTDVRDYVFYETATSPVHQRQNIFHEFGHLLADHDPVDADPSEDGGGVRALLPDLNPAVVARVLNRGGYDHVREREAELIASLLGLKVEAALSCAASVTFQHTKRPETGLATSDVALERMAVLFGRDGT